MHEEYIEADAEDRVRDCTNCARLFLKARKSGLKLNGEWTDGVTRIHYAVDGKPLCKPQ